MTDEHRQQVEKRWRESMALLGLDPETEPGRPSPAAVQEKPPAKLIAKVARPEPASEPERSEPEPEWPVTPPPELEAEAAHVREQIARDEAIEAPVGEEIGPEEEPAKLDEKPGRRRRGRRGRRVKKPDEAATGEDQAAAAESSPEAAEKLEDGPAPRKRGRPARPPRGKPVKDAEPVEVVDQDDDGEEPTSSQHVDEAEGDDDDLDTLNPEKWDVPSWQELIGSLYRPDR
jgi:hypothetical protein